jgi:ribosomal protein S18 acetylase RimI-like enzyme
MGLAVTSLEAKRAVARWLEERGSPFVVRITPLTNPTTAASCRRNWFLEPRDETIVMTKAIVVDAAGPDVVKADPLDEAFVNEFFSLNERRPEDDDTWPRLVGRVVPDATGLWVEGVAVGFVAVSGSLAFTYSVAVESAERRKGLGTMVMAAADAWAVQRGARSMVLQVLGTNTPARGLYERLGYSEAYRYHYLQAASYRPGGT